MKSNCTKAKCKGDDSHKPIIDLVDYDKHKTQKIPENCINDNFCGSADDTTDSVDEDGNSEDHLEKLDIETVAVDRNSCSWRLVEDVSWTGNFHWKSFNKIFVCSSQMS